MTRQHDKNKESEHQPSHHRDEVYTLSTPDQHQHYYDAWAKTYDQDFVQDHGYAYPERVARIFVDIAGEDHCPIADIGCGTGLVGDHLRRFGIKGRIDGFDISPGMLDIAREKNLYQGLYMADITAPLAAEYKGRYRGLISTGTFTLGHLGPDALDIALSLGQQNCLAMIGINALHFKEKGFDLAFDEWITNQRITPPQWYDVAIYHDDQHAKTDNTMAKLAVFRLCS